jgi:ubiquinone/menaquinone biosynthesis C-methylase UbiE
MFHPEGPSFFELAKQWLSSTERGYDLLAPKFDYTPFRTPNSVLSVVYEQLRWSAPISSLLDICCGTGAAMQWLRPLCSHRMVGIDMSKGMLEVARSTTRTAPGDAHVEFVRGNALHMPFGANFDLAVCFGAFGHILPQDEPQLICQIAGALRPGGRFVFVTSEVPPKWSRVYWFSRAFNVAMHLRNWIVKPPFIMYYLTFLLPEVKSLLEEGGFTVKVHQPFDGPLERLRLVIATRESH